MSTASWDWNWAPTIIWPAFNPRELVARIRAILRRVQSPSLGRLEVNGVTIDPGTREVTCDGRAIEMTTLEFDILEVLMRSAGRVVSRDALMESMYNRKPRRSTGPSTCTSVICGRSWNSSDALSRQCRIGYQFCRTQD